MGKQQGFAGLTPNYLIAAWKANPHQPQPGNPFSYGIDDRMYWASLYVNAPTNWSMNGALAAASRFGPALLSDQNLNPDGPGPTIYAVWKGQEVDERLFFSRLTLPFTVIATVSDPASATWAPQQQIPGAMSSSSPSFVLLGEIGSAAFLFTVWSGTANGHPIPGNNAELWYSLTPIPASPGYVDNLVAASGTVPGVSSATGATVAVDTRGNIWLVWFDTVAAKWCYLTQPFNNTPIQWTAPASPIALGPLANSAGYSLTQAFSGSQLDVYGVYAAWSDNTGKIWVSGVDNLITADAPASPLLVSGVQATGNNGCALTSLNQQVNGALTTVLWAMWADTTGQLHYASSTDAVTWEDYGDLSNATSEPDFGFEYPPVHLPIKFR